jgi:2-dehydropantoate 2-reductase
MNSISAAFREVGVDSEVSADITADLWRKFAFIASAAAACGLARCSVGELRSRPYGSLLFERAVREVFSVAKAWNVSLPDDEPIRMLKFFETLAADMKPSFLLDLEAGSQTEIDDLSGAVSRLGRLADIETIVHDTATTVLSI